MLMRQSATAAQNMKTAIQCRLSNPARSIDHTRTPQPWTARSLSRRTILEASMFTFEGVIGYSAGDEEEAAHFFEHTLA